MEQNNAEKTGLKFWKTEKNSNATDKNAIKHKINVSKCEQEKEKKHIRMEEETTKTTRFECQELDNNSPASIAAIGAAVGWES